MSGKPNTPASERPGRVANVTRWAKVICFAAVVVFLTLFVLRNDRPVQVDFVVADADIPLRAVILGSVGLGVIGTLLAVAFRNILRRK